MSDEPRVPVDQVDTSLGLPPPGTTRDTATVLARDITAVRRRVTGFTYEQIADELGYANRHVAREAVMRSLARVERHNVEELRALEDARLDTVTRSLMGIMLDSKVAPAQRIAAANSVTNTSARRARMLGLDAPTKVAVDINAVAEFDAIMSDIARLVTGEVLDSRIVNDDDGPAALAF